MSNILYSSEHEWVVVEDGVATIGISGYAQEQLGDVVYVELPAIGASVSKGNEAAVVESVKAASEVYAPVSGEVIEVNEALADDPALVNGDPLGDGWFMRVRLSDEAELGELMSESDYAEMIEGLEE